MDFGSVVFFGLVGFIILIVVLMNYANSGKAPDGASGILGIQRKQLDEQRKQNKLLEDNQRLRDELEQLKKNE